MTLLSSFLQLCSDHLGIVIIVIGLTMCLKSGNDLIEIRTPNYTLRWDRRLPQAPELNPQKPEKDKDK